MLDFFIALMRNIGLLATVALIYGAAIARLPKITWPAALGLLCGAGAAVAILDPTALAPGIPADMRTVLVLMASFIGGWVSAAIAIGLTIVVRATQSADFFLVSLTTFFMCGLIGIAGHLILQHRNTPIRMRHIVLISLCSPLISLSVLTLPHDLLVYSIDHYILPINVMRIIGLWVLGWMILHEGRRVDVANSVHRLAFTDDLSGLSNRRAFYAALDMAWQDWRQMGEPFCIIIIDIDLFKRINDSHGHPTGDEVIRRLGRILNEEKRVADTVARLGGEEFAVLLRGVRGRDCLAFAERLRRRVEAEAIETETEMLRFTVSLGASRDVAHCVDRQQILSSADNALYVAKREGRNRAVLDTSPAPA